MKFVSQEQHTKLIRLLYVVSEIGKLEYNPQTTVRCPLKWALLDMNISECSACATSNSPPMGTVWDDGTFKDEFSSFVKEHKRLILDLIKSAQATPVEYLDFNVLESKEFQDEIKHKIKTVIIWPGAKLEIETNPSVANTPIGKILTLNEQRLGIIIDRTFNLETMTITIQLAQPAHNELEIFEESGSSIQPTITRIGGILPGLPGGFCGIR